MMFLDTNIILRYLTRDDPVKAQACYAFFQRVQKGQETVTTSETHIAEVCFVLSSRRGPYQLSHDDIRARLLPVLKLTGLKLAKKRLILRALDIYASFPKLDFEDALAVATTEAEQLQAILSYDRDFDSVPNLTRVEPMP